MYRRRVGNPPHAGARPRLSPRVLPRRYVDERERVALHVGANVVVIEEGAWRVARALDGTRDVEGVRLAAYAAGVACTEEEVVRIVDELSSAGAIELGVEVQRSDQGEVEDKAEVEARPVVVLPGYTFVCDGRGGCCSQYASIALDDDDVQRARAAKMRLLPGDADGQRSLMPFDGSLSRRRLAMAVVEGSCLQLDASGRCGLHRDGGHDAKPKGCQRYPRTFVDDGESVRVSVGLECDCAIRSAANDFTEPLVIAARSTELAPEIAPRRIPELVPIAGSAAWRRADAARFMESLGRADGDVVRALVDGARRACAEARSAAGDPPDLGDMVRAYATATASADESARAWRAPSDRVRRIRAAARAAFDRVDLDTTASDPRAEAFFLRAATFGRDFLGPLPVAHALVGAAARLLVARHLDDPSRDALGHPIAVMEALARAFSPTAT